MTSGSNPSRGGGRLRLKNVAIQKVKRRPTHVLGKSDSAAPAEAGVDIPPSETKAGSGRIVSTGKTVHGFETKFKEEVNVGDTIILFHPKQLVDEERVVESVLSQRALCLASPFSSDVPSTCAFKIRNDSVALLRAAEKRLHLQGDTATDEGTSEEARAALLNDEVSRQLEKKLKKAKPTLTYREKTGMWGYKVVTEKLEKPLTHEELLDMRSKRQGRDKYCW